MTSFKYLFLIVVVVAGLSVQTALGQESQRSKPAIKEKLPVSFGTLATMHVEIVDGNELHDKAHQSSFLFRVKSVDSMALSTPVLVEFKDETGNFPNEVFALYKHVYGRKKGTISSGESEQLKKRYVGKEFNIVAYETGAFVGMPDGYYKYQPARQDYGFHFKGYLVVVSIVNK